MINEDCGCGGHKEKPTHMLHEPTEEQPGIKDVLKTALEKAIKQKSMNEEQATNFIREVIKKVNEKAPPGREDQVKALKGKVDNPFAVAWASYNKAKK